MGMSDEPEPGLTLHELRIALDPERRRAEFEAWKASHHEPCHLAGYGPCAGAMQNVCPMTLYGDEPHHYRMCERHAIDYHEHWSEMWDDYYRSRL